MIAFLSAILGQDRVSGLHWAAAALSIAGIYVVVGRDAALDARGLIGDVMMLCAVCCWAIYTIGSRQLMRRHSPVGVTGVSMSIGALVYVPLVWPSVAATNWMALSGRAWASLIYSAFLALCVAYTIWYAAVRQIGSARTSVYSNLVPLVAMMTAVVFLHEPLTTSKITGAAAVLVGVALTRRGSGVHWVHKVQ